MRNFCSQAFTIPLPLGIQHKPHKSKGSSQFGDGNTQTTSEMNKHDLNDLNIQQHQYSMHTRFVFVFSPAETPLAVWISLQRPQPEVIASCDVNAMSP